VQRHQPVLVLQRLGVVAGQRRLLHLGAELRRHVRRHRDAADPALRVEAERGGVLAGKLDEILAAGARCFGTRDRSPVASFTPTIRGSFASSPIVAGVMSITDRGGML
jgi:hypothetical protein